MIAIPAIDIRDGACVQLVGGSYADERIRIDDPLAVARQWAALGFHWLHVVDLDAATGAGSNDDLVERLVANPDVSGQVGGGIRDDARVDRLLACGAARVIVGTRAVEDLDWLASLAKKHPARIVVAADVRERRVLTHGWQRAGAHDVSDFVASIAALPLAGLLVTAVHREGRLCGTDLPLMEEIARASAFPVIASGGITTIDDLRTLRDAGVSAAVIGMALYTGALDPRATAEEFGR